MTSKVDKLTLSWIRDESDKLAVANGCRFSLKRARYAVDWIEENCYLHEGVPSGTKITLGDWQLDFVMRLFGWVRPLGKDEPHYNKPEGRTWVRRFRKASVWVPKKNAKALALETPIATPAGWTTIGKLKVGDTIFGEHGQQIRVTELHPICYDDAYQMRFSNGESITCNAEHLWETSSLRDEKTKVRTTAEIARHVRTRGDGACNHSMRLSMPLQCRERKLFMDPYVLGVWLGDGDSDGARITCDVKDVPTYRAEFTRAGMVTREFSPKAGQENCGRLPFGVLRGDARTLLRKHDLFRNKHIPKEYLRGSIAQRTALLQGLMDTDGTVTKDGKQLEFCTKLPALRDGIAELLSSLGVKYAIHVSRPIIAGRQRAYYSVMFHAFRDVLPCFRLRRKLDRQRLTTGNVMRARSRTVQILSCVQTLPTPMRCITVDNPSGLFLCGRKMLITHNSPTVAAIALHLLIADGEQGQNVYTAAKDGKQALIVQGHAMNMIKASPHLRSVCNVNKSTKRILYAPTVSKMDVVAGDNKDSQEGLNGSVVVDEVHVVGAALMAILEGAGISRAEPLHVEVSTAGNNPDGYGKKQFDKAKRIIEGTEEDQTFLAIIYAAPQDLKFADLEADPLKYIKMANPSLGRIVNQREVMDVYNDAKKSLTKLLNFMMYRLNIWQHASNPWLKPGDWQLCKGDFTEADAAGKSGPCGMDFARIHDMTASVIFWQHPTLQKTVKRKDGSEATVPVCCMLPRFWMAEEAAKAQPAMPFVEWGDAGHLILTPGNTIDPGYVMTDFLEWIERLKFRVTTLGGDPSFGADAIMEMITDGVRDKDGKHLRAGCGAKRVEFQQNWKVLTEPTELFEGAVMDATILHNNNPVMNWQIGHVALRKSTDGELKMPQKPDGKKEGVRKIDGVMAAVFGYAIFKRTPPDSGLEIWSMG